MMKITLPDFNKAKVLVIGDLMLDRYWHGDTSRISPEAPVQVVNIGETEDRAGGAANVALNIAALGAKVTLCGITGDDAEAKHLEQLLTAKGVACHFDKRVNQTTITKLRVISRNQQLIRLDFEKDFSLERQLELSPILDLIESHDALVISDYNKGTLKDPSELIQQARRLSKSVVVDPKGSNFAKYRGATLITPNQSEFEAIVGKTSNDQDLLAKGEALRQELNLSALLVTRSEKGMALLEQNKEPYLQATEAKEVSDVTGAGDTVVATLAAAVAAGAELDLACRLANLTAGVVVSKVGTATVTESELRQAIKQQNHHQEIVDEQELLDLIAAAKQKNQTVVMTNGCFDLLHPGHIAYLKEAAALGDRLIVAVNSDDSVKRLKGESRPINDLAFRMEMLAALNCVDWVVVFEEDTPERIIGECLPDILVKGGDYQAEKIAGYKVVSDNGGRIKILQFKQGFSSSNLIEKIKLSD